METNVIIVRRMSELCCIEAAASNNVIPTRVQ